MQSGARDHREVLIGDVERMAEVLRIEVGVGCRLQPWSGTRSERVLLGTADD
jgi:hypothetical protein